MNRLVRRCFSISAKASRASNLSEGINTVLPPRAIMFSWCTPAPCDSGRQHERAIVLGGARHQVAQMVGDDEAHLPMGQHRGFRPAGRARGEEQPAGAVPLHRARWARGRPALSIDATHRCRIALRPRFPGEPDALDSGNGCGSPARRTRENRSGTGRPAAASPPPCRPRRPASAGSWSAPRPHRCGRSRASTPASRCCSCCAPARPRPAGRPAPAARRPRRDTRASSSRHVQDCSRQTSARALREAPGVLRDQVREVHRGPRHRRLMNGLHFARSRMET